MSENGLIVTDHLGIRLYHIPEPRAVGDDSNLVPVWSWSGDASEHRGTLYETASPYPALWLQGEWTTHTLEFDVDKSGCIPMVVNHQITEGRPAHYVGDRIKLQGRKVMSISIGQAEDDEIVINTGVLGKPDITRQLRVQLPGLYESHWYRRDELKYADLDEATGRIMIVLGSIRCSFSDARQLLLAELPI